MQTTSSEAGTHSLLLLPGKLWQVGFGDVEAINASKAVSAPQHTVHCEVIGTDGSCQPCKQQHSG